MQSLSDQAPVTTEWNEEPSYLRPQMWHLNKFLLESPGLTSLVENEILGEGRVATNRGSASPEIVWDAFKAHLRGILILFKAFRDNTRGVTRATLQRDIRELEDWYKMCNYQKYRQLIQEAYGSLKMLDAKEISQEML